MKMLALGVPMNLGKRNLSVRFGARDLGSAVGTAGKRSSAGIRGSGLYYTRKLGGRRAAVHIRPGAGRLGLLVLVLLLVTLIAWLTIHLAAAPVILQFRVYAHLLAPQLSRDQGAAPAPQAQPYLRRLTS